MHSLYQDDEGSRGEFLKLLAEQGEAPAFIRRAQAVEKAWEDLKASCRAQREQMLLGPRLHLRSLAQRVKHDWSRLADLLADEREVSSLRELHDRWHEPGKTCLNINWSWSLKSPLKRFIESANRFNELWTAYLRQLDLEEVNQMRRNYNNYYPMEKCCAFGFADVDRLGFEPLKMATTDDLLNAFPLLRAPQLRAS